jgi:hypothetical protein
MAFEKVRSEPSFAEKKYMYKLNNHFRSALKSVLISSISFASWAFAQNEQSKSKNELILPTNLYELNFVWQSDTINNRWEPNAAMLIPIKFPKCPKTFYMQFDLGAVNSVFYIEKIKSIRNKYPKSLPSLDTTLNLNAFDFSLDGIKIIATKFKVMKYGNKTINWNSNKSIDIIGTVGMDFIEGKVLCIDYPNKKMMIANSIPKQINEKLVLTDFTLMRNSILLPVVIKGKKTILFFDTGSSAYELLCSKETCLMLADNSIAPEVHTANSWGTILTANAYVTKDSLEIAQQKLPIGHATYIEGASDSQIQQMMKLGIGGMTGNKLFLNATLVIDTKNKKFGIIPRH